MKIIKDIAGRLFALWALVTFFITFLVIFIPSMLCYLVPEPQGQRLFIGLANIWMRVWLPLSGCRYSIKGKEHFKKGETYIVTCNHNSLMDVPLSSAFTPVNKTIAKASFTNIPLFGLFYSKGSVLVNRKSEASRKQSFSKMKKVLQQGMHMCIYPEGTRNRTAEPLKKFHDGAFRLATETGHAIIPGVIFNTGKVLPSQKPFFFWPGKIEIHYLEPVPSASISVEELKEKVFNVMTGYYVAKTGQKLVK